MSHLISMTPTPRLSAVVLAFNELKTVARCIDALLAFCDEVIVIDDCSTDGTWEYLKSREPRIRAVQHRHTTFTAQRELGRSLATGDWLLSMDADEFVNEALAKEIRARIGSPSAPDGFFLRRKNAYPRTLTGYYWTKHPRLVRTERCRWVQTPSPHSPLDMKGLRFETMAVGHLDHAPLADVATAMRKNVNRGLILSAQERAAGRRMSGFKLVAATLARFFKFYFSFGGFRHGASGIVMSLVMAHEAMAKACFLVETPQKEAEQLQDGGPGSYPVGTKFTG